MDCTMEIAETPENGSGDNPEKSPEIQPATQIKSPEVKTPSQSESQPQKEPLPEASLISQIVPPTEAAISPQTASSSEASSFPAIAEDATSVLPNMTNGPAAKKQRLDYHSMSTGVYLDSTVVPILHVALVTLDRMRPADPVQFVIDFLLRNKAQYSKSKEQSVPTTSAANQA